MAANSMRLTVTTLVFCVAALLALGLVMLYSASMVQDGARYVLMQAAWTLIGLLACLTAASVDYRRLKGLALPIFAVALVLLVAVLVVGRPINGARRWFDFQHIRFQPSEFAKLAVVIALAWYCDRYQRHIPTFNRGLLIPGLFIGLVLGLIFIEPDRGTTILLAAVTGAMLVIAGVRFKHLLPFAGLALAGLVVSLLQDPVRFKRIVSWLNPEATRQGTGYQAYQAMLALGSGGWTGLGLGDGRQKLGFVPEHHTDFIFSIIGEELGLVATLLVIAVFAALVVCGLRIAVNARDTFGLLLGSGITFLIGLQAFINIGVVTSALPNKGMPLPFISYGGSNLLLMFTGVGLLLGIARQARIPEFGAEETGVCTPRIHPKASH